MGCREMTGALSWGNQEGVLQPLVWRFPHAQSEPPTASAGPTSAPGPLLSVSSAVKWVAQPTCRVVEAQAISSGTVRSGSHSLLPANVLLTSPSHPQPLSPPWYQVAKV